MTQETITQIPIDQLVESPFNPRQIFKGIEELAANIRTEGRIHEPLLVRPITPNPLRDDIVDGYEVVFGHRRLRAAEMACLATVPCMVRAMTNAEARSAQTAENLQREDVHPFEEAAGFQSMIENDGHTADTLATLVGKSRSYVYSRLKLLRACDEVRQQCLDGTIDAEATLLVARLGSESLQQKALAAIRNDTSTAASLTDGGKRSYRHIRDLLAEKFTLGLKDAIFDPEDAALLPAAGVCSACPRLAGNAPEYADLAAPARDGEHRCYTRAGGPNVCTDPECFASKKAAHLARKAAELTAAGAIVVTGNKAKQAVDAYGKLKAGYVPLKDAQAALKKAGKGAPEIEVVSVIDQRTGNVIKAAKVATPAPTKSTPKKSSNAQLDFEAKRELQHAELVAERKRREALCSAIRPRMLEAKGSTTELRLIVWVMMSFAPYEIEREVLKLHDARPDAGQGVTAWLDALTADQLRTVLMDFVLTESRTFNDWEPDSNRELMNLVARLYDVEPEATPAATREPEEVAA